MLTCCRFLWPTYTEDASNYHVLLLGVIVGVKQREHLPIWGMYNMVMVYIGTLLTSRRAL
jgi:hypothetical protein